MKAYYEARAREYDDWWLGRGLHAERDRPGWFEEVVALLGAVASLPPARTLDVACGTGFLTRHLHGEMTGLDQSASMLEAARAQVPGAAFVRGEALELPFADGAFERLFTAHFYGHLEPAERARFLAEARRVAGELVVVDSALREGVEPEERQERELKDGTRWQVYKRYFDADGLLAELGGGETLFAGTWFVAVRSVGSTELTESGGGGLDGAAAGTSVGSTELTESGGGGLDGAAAGTSVGSTELTESGGGGLDGAGAGSA